MNTLKKITVRRKARSRRTKLRVAKGGQLPRLIIHRSNQQIYAQVVDSAGRVLAEANSLKLKSKDNLEVARQVGKLIAEAAAAKQVKEVTFDRKHYKYHGRVKALADTSREAGLKF